MRYRYGPTIFAANSGPSTLSGDAALAVASTLIAGGTIATDGSAALSAASSIVAAPTVPIAEGEASLSAASSLVADGLRLAVGDAALASVSSLSGLAVATDVTGASGLAAAAALVANGDVFPPSGYTYATANVGILPTPFLGATAYATANLGPANLQLVLARNVYGWGIPTREGAYAVTVQGATDGHVYAAANVVVPVSLPLEVAFVSNESPSTVSFPEPITADMTGFLFAHAAVTSVTGGFANWDLVYEGPATGDFATDGRRLRVYRGWGVSGTTQTTVNASGVWLGAALVVFRDCPSTAGLATIGTNEYGNPLPATISVGGTASAGDTVITAVRVSDFGSPDGDIGTGAAYVDTGFTGQHLRAGGTSTYTHAIGVSVGTASGGAVATDFDVVATNGAAQLAAFKVTL